ncbi:autophagy-related protein 7 [Hordeum vulgare]|nr:autophagy-related protein 7 [Hordeum vulgare]
MVVLLAPYDGFTKAEEVPIVYMPIWLHIHKLPDGAIREVGKVLQCLRYHWHEHKEGGNGVFEEKDLKFGTYLYADHLVRGRSNWEDQTGNKANINPSVSSPVVSPTTVHPCKPWSAPAMHEVALSVDGSFDPADGSAGSGMFLRDNKGAVMFASYRKLIHCNEALEAELQAMKERLELAVVHSQATILLQPNCDVALKMIEEESFDRSAYGHIVSDIRRYLMNRVVISLKISRE